MLTRQPHAENFYRGNPERQIRSFLKDFKVPELPSRIIGGVSSGAFAVLNVLNLRRSEVLAVRDMLGLGKVTEFPDASVNVSV